MARDEAPDRSTARILSYLNGRGGVGLGEASFPSVGEPHDEPLHLREGFP